MTSKNTEIRVLKRNGTLEPLDVEKIHRVIMWACEGRDASPSLIEMKAHLQFYDKIKTSDIHAIVIKSAADLISAENPDYADVAACLNMFALRKVAYGRFEPPALYDQVKNVVEKGFYDPELLVDYTQAEFDEMDTFIDHSLDMKYAYAAVKQFEGKYLVKNRVTGVHYETPQFGYMLIAAALHSSAPKDKRMGYIKEFYEEVSQQRFSLPTPIMSGVRTKTRQFSSCVLIEAGDSLGSINAAASAVVKYVSQRAGIGLNTGALRALGSEIRNGEAFHTGVIPFYKYFQTAVKCCSQGGVRGGAATVFYPMWHYETPELFVLKNNKGVEENRVRHMDYGVQINKTLYTRLIRGGNITLFSPSDTPGLLDSFYADQDKFEELYVKYENDPTIRKRTIPASEHFANLMIERGSTGRIYIQNIDHSNTHSSFIESVAPIKQSNLCLEITLPTKPLVNIDSEEGEVALCTLSAFNLGLLDSDDFTSLRKTARVVVRALDYLLDYQDYPVKAAEYWSKARRSLGVGAVNYAYWLAKNGMKYSDGSANNATHRLFEAIQYYLIEASVELAKEKGACEAFNETKYSRGILPIDTYKETVDSLHDEPLHMDWESLRADVVKYGMRNSTLTALMPSETSSQILNATNGIEPPRGLVSVKLSKDGVLKQVVPDIKNLKDKYELLWDIPDNKGYLDAVGIMQKFVDQAISANTNYDPQKFPSGKVSMKVILNDLLTAYQNGLKTLYYHNTRDGAKDSSTEEVKKDEVVIQEDESCGSGGCKI